MIDGGLPGLLERLGRTPADAAVGAERFHFGFPAGVFALPSDGVLRPQIRRGTTVDDAGWAKLLMTAGIPAAVEADMHAWLRSHAALVSPLMAIGTVAARRGAGVSWREAGLYIASEQWLRDYGARRFVFRSSHRCSCRSSSRGQ